MSVEEQKQLQVEPPLAIAAIVEAISTALEDEKTMDVSVQEIYTVLNRALNIYLYRHTENQALSWQLILDFCFIGFEALLLAIQHPIVVIGSAFKTLRTDPEKRAELVSAAFNDKAIKNLYVLLNKVAVKFLTTNDKTAIDDLKILITNLGKSGLIPGLSENISKVINVAIDTHVLPFVLEKYSASLSNPNPKNSAIFIEFFFALLNKIDIDKFAKQDGGAAVIVSFIRETKILILDDELSKALEEILANPKSSVNGVISALLKASSARLKMMEAAENPNNPTELIEAQTQYAEANKSFTFELLSLLEQQNFDFLGEQIFVDAEEEIEEEIFVDAKEEIVEEETISNQAAIQALLLGMINNGMLPGSDQRLATILSKSLVGINLNGGFFSDIKNLLKCLELQSQIQAKIATLRKNPDHTTEELDNLSAQLRDNSDERDDNLSRMLPYIIKLVDNLSHNIQDGEDAKSVISFLAETLGFSPLMAQFEISNELVASFTKILLSLEYIINARLVDDKEAIILPGLKQIVEQLVSILKNTNEKHENFQEDITVVFIKILNLDVMKPYCSITPIDLLVETISQEPEKLVDLFDLYEQAQKRQNVVDETVGLARIARLANNAAATGYAALNNPTTRKFLQDGFWNIVDSVMQSTIMTLQTRVVSQNIEAFIGEFLEDTTKNVNPKSLSDIFTNKATTWYRTGKLTQYDYIQLSKFLLQGIEFQEDLSLNCYDLTDRCLTLIRVKGDLALSQCGIKVTDMSGMEIDDNCTMSNCIVRDANLCSLKANALNIVGSDIENASFNFGVFGDVRIEGTQILNFEMSELAVRDTITIVNSKIENMVFNDLKAKKLDLKDCDLKNVDLGGLSVEELILENCTLSNTEMTLIGEQNKAINTDLAVRDTITIVNSKIENMVFKNLQAKKLHLKNCNLKNVDLRDLSVEELILENCTLSDTEITFIGGQNKAHNIIVTEEMSFGYSQVITTPSVPGGDLSRLIGSVNPLNMLPPLQQTAVHSSSYLGSIIQGMFVIGSSYSSSIFTRVLSTNAASQVSVNIH
jgi:uncharacterized protein YjbI with pentapeptide repeats